jgi:hypothetical protein
MEEEFPRYEHELQESPPLYDFPLDHPDVTLNKSIEDPNEFEKFMVIFSKHKESSSPLTSGEGDAMITE